MIEAIAAVGADSVSSLAAPMLTSSKPDGLFDAITARIGEVNDKVAAADDQVRKLALGEADSLHGVMISLADARVSMGLMVQVRNRLVEAYQDVMRMQI